MQNADEDINTALPETPSPPMADRRWHSALVIGALIVLAVGMAALTLLVILHGGTRT
jgi:hypothetical protein